MNNPKNISIKDYSYVLPPDRIAKFPLKNRDDSKLLVYRGERIFNSKFNELSTWLPESSLLVFNVTKVIHARIRFVNSNGATIECFCLEPADDVTAEQVFSSHDAVSWNCLIGNNRKWKSGSLQKTFSGIHGPCILKATRREVITRDFIVDFSWDNKAYSFSEVIENAGELPIPPYLNRNAEPEDEERYNTVYAKMEGSVAAPTAGLHFTDRLIDELKEQKVSIAEVTLHVGAGTFRPVSSETMENHEMHAERILILRSAISAIIQAKLNGTVIAVGTTSARTIESLYWFGVRILEKQFSGMQLSVEQWDPYGELNDSSIPSSVALNAVLNWMDENKLIELSGYTRLMIAPGYDFKVADALITNFHQPDSTLLLLVAALTGNDWRKIYDVALKENYRFLSYGDSSLLFKVQMS